MALAAQWRLAFGATCHNALMREFPTLGGFPFSEVVLGCQLLAVPPAGAHQNFRIFNSPQDSDPVKTLMKALLILAATAIGTLIGYAKSEGFRGGSIGGMLNGLATLMFMAAGGGAGLALGVVIALIWWASEPETSRRQKSTNLE